MQATTLQIVQVTLQALSALAIAGGLLYTAVQFRSARQAQAVANFAKIVELQFQLRKMRVENPALAAVSKLDVAHLQSDREVQEYFLQLMQLSLFEIAWSVEGGWALDEPADAIGSTLVFPPWFADRKDEMIAGLEPANF